MFKFVDFVKAYLWKENKKERRFWQHSCFVMLIQ